jgi:hypothetical protein
MPVLCKYLLQTSAFISVDNLKVFFPSVLQQICLHSLSIHPLSYIK